MKTILIFLFASIVLFSCKKEDKNHGTVTFYLESSAAGENWELLINGLEKGKLTASAQKPDCEDSEFITLVLPIGSHKVNAKNLDSPNTYGIQKTIEVVPGCNQHMVIILW